MLAALAKLPADRLRSGAAFIETLTAHGSKGDVSPALPQEPIARRDGSWRWQLLSGLLVVVAAAGWTLATRGTGAKYTGPRGCEAQDGVWRHVGAGMSGMWITHNGYAIEVLYRNGAKTPETSTWRLMRCTDTTTTSVYLESSLTSSDGAALQTGAEVTGPVRIEDGVMVWRNPGKDGQLGEEHRGERIR